MYIIVHEDLQYQTIPPRIKERETRRRTKQLEKGSGRVNKKEQQTDKADTGRRPY